MLTPEREKGGLQAGHRDPTPEEIRAMCAEIQATWTAEEEQQRCGARPNIHLQATAIRHGRPSGRRWRPPIRVFRFHGPE